MERLVIGVAVVLAAGLVALVIGRRRPGPWLRSGDAVPARLDRSDFGHVDAPWLVVFFSSATCDSCEAVADALREVSSRQVAVEEVEYSRRRDLHRRYRIDAVPLTLIADANGVVRASFLGRITAGEVRAALEDAGAP